MISEFSELILCEMPAYRICCLFSYNVLHYVNIALDSGVVQRSLRALVLRQAQHRPAKRLKRHFLLSNGLKGEERGRRF